MATAEMGLRGAHHPTPFLTWLTPGLLNHATGAQRGLVILPGSLPPCFGVTVLIFGFLTDAVKAHDSPWQAGPEEAGCASSCPADCCRTSALMTTQPPPPGATEAADRDLGSWAGAPVTPAPFSAAEAGRRAIPTCGHGGPELVLPQRGGICPCFDHLLESLVHTRVVALITSSQTKELWQNRSEGSGICNAACECL